MPDAPQKFYLTTPIYYVNARPHIGHAYTTIVADVLARRHRLLGEDVFLLTGTDEHGQKIERSAAAANIPPQQFADQVSAYFEALWQRMGITYNKFIRTTSPEHKRGVPKFWRALEERGYIYLDTYTGQYCVSNEAFYDVPAGAPCPECGRITETVTEENYYFKLSAFQDKLIDLIETSELSVEPETRRNEVLSFLRGNTSAIIQSETGEAAQTRSVTGTTYVPGALKDLSISRTSFKWGIPAPGNDKHVVYVWLDALANYMTALGYGSEDESQWQHYWPADLHLVGKEIIRFHCVYWPAFLLAAGLPLPKKVQAHGWLLFEESKMSKSRGNIVRTETILDAFGDQVYGKQFPNSTQAERDLFASDVLRYFLLREIPFGQDGSFSFDALITRYNADLANGYGNLVSRTLALIQKGLGGEFQAVYDGGFASGTIEEDDEDPIDKPFDWTLGTPGEAWWANEPWEKSPTLEQAVTTHFENMRFGLAAEQIWQAIRSVDTYLSDNTPWKLIGTIIGTSESGALEPLDKILYTAAESIRIITALLHPIMPYATARVWSELGLGNIELAAKNGELKNLQWGGLKPGTRLGELAPIFPRAEKGLAQIMTDMEANSTATNPGAPSSAPQEPKVSSPESPTITIDDFAKIDLRAAVILVAERIPKADKLLRLEVDLGNGEKRQILSGIAEHYAPEDLIGRRIVIIANLAPRKMRGLESHGMLLAASEGENGKPILATFAEDIAPGSRLK